jgi:hypothetical protein
MSDESRLGLYVTQNDAVLSNKYIKKNNNN